MGVVWHTHGGDNYKVLISGMWTKTFPLFKIFNFSILLFRSLEFHTKPCVKITKKQAFK